MFCPNACVQAFMKGCPRYCKVCGRIRIQTSGCGAVIQLKLSGLPCECCRTFYALKIEGGCGCQPICLPNVPVWQGEAMMTFFLGGITAENLVRREIVLYLNDSCCGRVAEGIIQPCGWMEECLSPCTNCCKPLYPQMPCTSCCSSKNEGNLF